MKKYIIISLSLFISTSAFAADNITMSSDLTATSSKSGLSVYGDKTDATAATAALIGKTSTGVSVGVKTGAGGYAVITQHKSGTKAFASAFDSTSIYTSNAAAGTATLAVPGGTGVDAISGTGWTTM